MPARGGLQFVRLLTQTALRVHSMHGIVRLLTQTALRMHSMHGREVSVFSYKRPEELEYPVSEKRFVIFGQIAPIFIVPT